MDSYKLQRQEERQFKFLRWLPIGVAMILLLMVAVVSVNVLSQLRTAIAWRQHTVQVILTADAFQDNLLNIQRNVRSYVSTGDTNALVAFQKNLDLEPAQFNQLVKLTSDNSNQQQQLKKLDAAMQAVFSYDQRLITVFAGSGAAGVLKADFAGSAGRAVFGSAIDALNAFSATEQTLLDLRDATEQSNYHSAQKLLLAGCILAVVLIVFANLVANHELALRRRAEKKLNRALMLQSAILVSADYGIVTTNPDGIIQTFNPASEQMLGYSAKEIIGRETPMLWREPQEIAERAASLSKRLGRAVKPSFDAVATKVQFEGVDDGEWTFIRKDGKRFFVSLVVTALTDRTGNFTGFIGIFRDISVRKAMEADREKLIYELKEALAQVKTLSGLIPICGWCKNIRNDSGYWLTVEQYMKTHTDATFTHGMCPDCQEKFKTDIARANDDKAVR